MTRDTLYDLLRASVTAAYWSRALGYRGGAFHRLALGLMHGSARLEPEPSVVGDIGEYGHTFHQ